MQVRLAPSPDSGRAARLAVTDVLHRLDRHDLVDDVTLVTAELVANAVLHARSEITVAVEPVGDGVRITVTDGSSILPRWSPSSATATAGRGLQLVERLSRRWGFEPLPAHGKRVWAEVHAGTAVGPDVDATPEDLLEQWPDEAWPAVAHVDGDVDAEVEVDVTVDVEAMLASRAHTEELVRDLQLTFLDARDREAPTAVAAEVVDLARRLDAANEDFHEARRQIYNQTIRARKHGRRQTTLHLRLRRSDQVLARRWLEALDAADALTAAGVLLLPPFPAELTAFRRRYIADIVEQLTAAG